MTKKSRKKCKYLQNKKSILDKTKSIFHHFLKAFIKANNSIFLEGQSPILKKVYEFDEKRDDDKKMIVKH